MKEYPTGAMRSDNAGKPRPDLISPYFMERLGRHLAAGATAYGEWNWAKGIPNSRCFESLMRHLMQYAQGRRDEDHLAAAAANLMFLIHNEEYDDTRELVDFPVFADDRYIGGAE